MRVDETHTRDTTAVTAGSKVRMKVDIVVSPKILSCAVVPKELQ